MMCNLLKEAVVVGVVFIFLGNLFGYLLSGSRLSVKLPKECSTWNKNYVMEMTLFLSGFFGHLLFEQTGLNKWYCKYGNACRK